MELFFNKLFSNIPVSKPTNQPGQRSYSTGIRGGLQNDMFVKNAEPVFTGKRGSGSTKKGAVLKELDNITCPYSGVKMLSAKKIDKIEAELAKTPSITGRIDILEQYKPNMQKLEKNMFAIFKGYAANHPEGNLNACLRELYPDSLAELKIEQIKVLDKVDKVTKKMDAKTALEVRKITTDARRKILSDTPETIKRNPKARTADHIFKRKDLLDELRDATIHKTNPELFDEMWQAASELPKSSTSMDAFIVKYADRPPVEIATRLLRPSTTSIEHITPANPDSITTEAGENELTNFMPASRDWNTARGNNPLPEFIKQHRNIPRYSQKMTDDIIKAIYHGKMPDCDWYPYVLKEKMYNESQGLINVNIDKYKVSEADAFKNAPEKVIDAYNRLKEENKNIG